MYNEKSEDGFMLIFEKRGEVTPEKDKTNIVIPFEVPDGIEKLIIDYSYSPKTEKNREKSLERIRNCIEKYSAAGEPEAYLPVKNLITLSLDDSSGFRGAAHRQADSQHHEISADFASNGFVKGKISSGTWRVVLNVHCCVCKVNYMIKISGEGKTDEISAC